jgi:MacB-like periplasmic core domain/Glycosyltransferase family 87
MFTDLLLDTRFAWRGLSRARGFTGAAVVVLGVGIAGATAMLALVQGVLLRPLPVRDQQRLIIAWKDLKASGYQHYPFGDRAITSLSERTHLLEPVAGVTTNGLSHWIAVDDDGGAAYIKGALVTGGFFEVLDVNPVLGRRLMPSDDREGSEAVVVISAGLWQRRYGRSLGVVGRHIMLDERAFTIVGVMPPDIDYPRGVELWRTTRSVPISQTFGDAARQEVDLIARLRTDVTVEQAAGELSALTRQFDAEAPVFCAVNNGQTSILLAVAVLGVYRASERSQAWTAGAWLSVPSIKPQLLPLVPIYLAARRRWRVIACGILILAILAALTTAARFVARRRSGRCLLHLRSPGPCCSPRQAFWMLSRAVTAMWLGPHMFALTAAPLLIWRGWRPALRGIEPSATAIRAEAPWR